MFSFPTGTHHYAASPLGTVHDVRLVGLVAGPSRETLCFLGGIQYLTANCTLARGLANISFNPGSS